MKRSVLLLGCLAACSGPPAPDAAVCQDFIHRVCVPPVCQSITDNLQPGVDCETTLLQRTGCAADDFAFSGITRDRFLSCRLPLLRAGSSSNTPPNCDDVQDVITLCPDVVAFMNGSGQ